jgi:hypothetical protein
MGIETAIAAAIAAAGASAATAALIASVIVNTVISVGLGILSSALTPKPKTPNLDGGFSNQASGITQNIKQAVTVRRTLYGEARVGGALTFIETSNNDKYIHIVLTVADHECEEIGEIWFNDVSIPLDALDADGNVVSGDYNGYARIKKHLGGVGQVADPDIVSETTATTDFIGTGLTYIYARLLFSRDKYPTSVPVITAFVKGKKILDPRDDVERWTANGALFVRDYLIQPLDSLTPGAGIASEDIDDIYLASSANVSDEIVTTDALPTTVTEVDATGNILVLDNDNDTLIFQTGDQVRITTTDTVPAGLALATDYYVIPYQRKTTLRIKLATTMANAMAGVEIDITDIGAGVHTLTKNGEPRYYGGGIIETSTPVGDNVKALLTCIGGDFIYVGGAWKIKAASYHTPVYSFDEGDLINQMSVQTKASRRDRFNQVKGIYVSQLNEGEPADYPPVSNSNYVASDNNKLLPIDYDLTMTQRPHTAQRLAKIKLERHRQELFFEGDFNLSAMQVQPGDVVNITNTRMGWDEKPFEVVKWTLANEIRNKVPMFYIKMALQETASSVFGWTFGEETAVDPAPNTNLPNPLFVESVVGFSLDTYPVETKDGDIVYNVKAFWVESLNPFVASGGKYEVKFKETTTSTYGSAGIVDGNVTEMILTTLKPDPVLYDVQIYAYNNIGVRSLDITIEDFKLGDSVITDAEDWENETSTAEDWENDTLTAEDWN